MLGFATLDLNSVIRTVPRCSEPLPGRRKRLPAHAPLRTVLESFPSHGSSPHKVSLGRTDPRPHRIRELPLIPGDHLAILIGGHDGCVSLETSTPGRINRQASVVICFSQLVSVPHTFLPFQTRPTWAYPAHYVLALASSVIPMLRLLTRLAVGSARWRAGARVAAFPCSVVLTG